MYQCRLIHESRVPVPTLISTHVTGHSTFLSLLVIYKIKAIQLAYIGRLLLAAKLDD